MTAQYLGASTPFLKCLEFNKLCYVGSHRELLTNRQAHYVLLLVPSLGFYLEHSWGLLQVGSTAETTLNANFPVTC